MKDSLFKVIYFNKFGEIESHWPNSFNVFNYVANKNKREFYKSTYSE